MMIRLAGVLLITVVAQATSLFAQSRPLNPTVKVLPRAQGSVPADCDEGAAPAPAPPRVQVTEIPREPDVRADMQAPPSRDLRDTMRNAQAAAESNNREGFRTSLIAAREIAATYPPGGERTAATEAIAVLNDVERLWEYQFSSPTGAFFDASAENGALLAMLNKYRGFDEAVRRQTIVDANGTRFYPTRESREFLLRESSQRLARLGVKTGTTPVARATTPAPVPATRPAVTTPAPSTPRKTPTTTTATTTPRKRSAVKSPATKRTTSTPRTSSKPRATAKKPAVKRTAAETAAPPKATEPAPVAATTDDLTIGSSPVVSTTETTETIAPISETTTSTGTSATMSAQPSETATAATTTAEKPAGRGRSIMMPLVLILIGVGVLVVLFRASS